MRNVSGIVYRKMFFILVVLPVVEKKDFIHDIGVYDKEVNEERQESHID